MIEVVDYKYWNYVIHISFIVVSLFLLYRLLRFLLERYLASSSEFLHVEPTNYYFFKNALSFIFIISATLIILITIPEFKELGLTLATSAGIFAAILGFASQAAFSNIISGTFIVIFKPFRVGDNVKISDRYHGIIEDITLRHTVIRDFENNRFIIPNSTISSETIHNSSISDYKVRKHIELNLSFKADLKKAISIIRDEIENHPLCIDNRTGEGIMEGVEKVVIKVIAWEEYYVRLRAYVWTERPGSAFDLKCDVLMSIKEAFDRAGIEMAYPLTNVILKNRDEQ